ncbi:MAG: squalene synthase HpnC [Verrucomicrobium sp.]|nr:squalene synthase HpnC [Verrucomicrobium sp.]
MTADQAYAHCTALARSHYENFPVGRLVPKRLAPHVHAVYAFARHADDLADEGYAADHDFADGKAARRLNPEERLEALDQWERDLLRPGEEGLHPILLATRRTIQTLDLPTSLFTDLLSAFKQDVVKRRYATHAEILDYCRRSANPVGRLVLLLHGHRAPEQLEASDAICTALQLANFWQDVSVDLLKDRIYLPEEDRQAHGVSEEDLFAKRCTPGYRALLRFQVERTHALFRLGRGLAATLPRPLRWEIELTWLGGSRILEKIETLDYDTLHTRPKLTKGDVPLLLGRLLFY